MPSRVGPAYDPATGQPYQQGSGSYENQALANAGKGAFNANQLSQQTQQAYETDLIDMATAGGTPQGTIELPPGVGAAEFAQLQSTLDTFAASAGFRYFPTGNQINALLGQVAGGHLNLGDQQAVFQYLAKSQGVAAAMPWAAAGLTKGAYNNQKDSLQQQMAEYTGDPAMYGDLLQQALTHGSSASSWMQTQLTTNAAYSKNGKTPWLQYNMTAQQFKQQAAQDKQLIASHFGGNASLTQQAEFLGTGLADQHRSSSGGGAISLPTTKQGPLVKPQSQSSIR